MRILFASTAGAGHIAPLVPIAHAALRAGHEVLVATPPAGERHVHRAGLPWRATAAPDPERLARVRRGLDDIPERAERIAAAVTEMFGRTYSGAALPAMLGIVEDWAPDVVVTETCEMSSVAASERHGVPLVRAAIGLSVPFEQAGVVLARPVLDELRASAGVAPDPGGKRVEQSLLVSQAPVALDPPGAPTDPRYVVRVRNPAHGRGAELPEGWIDAQDPRPLVYLSLGSEAPSRQREDFPGLYRELATALGRVDARVVVAIGDERTPEELGPVPENCCVVQWAPQSALMPHVSAHVTHAGSNSTLDSLASGVPMVCVPLFADQPMNAQAVAAVGAGLALGRDEAARAGAAVEQLLGEMRFRAVAQALARRIAALPPTDVVVPLLEDVADGWSLAA